MLITSANTTALTALVFSARICVREDSGRELCKIKILDRDGFEVFSTEVDGVTEYCVSIENEPRARLPIRVVVNYCEGGNESSSDPLLTELVIVTPEGELDCRRAVLGDFRPPNPACDNARSELRAERAAFRSACEQVRYRKRRRDEFFTLAAFFATAAAAAFLGAASVAGIPIVGQILMAVLIGIAAFSLYFAGLYALKAFRENQRLEEAEAVLRNRRNTFDETAERVSTNCCPDTIDESLDTPEC